MLLIGAAGLPYVMSATKGDATSVDSAPSKKAKRAETPGGVGTPSLEPDATMEMPTASIAGTGVDNMATVFSFDVSTAWVLGHWSRVSTGLADLDLQGYRVPLVTGTQPSDLSGSLTYYFNKQQRVERIVFRGLTGDARRIVALLATKHGFLRELADDPGLFLYRAKDGRRVTGEMRIRPRRIVRANAPNGRFDVDLVMDRPR